MAKQNHAVESKKGHYEAKKRHYEARKGRHKAKIVVFRWALGTENLKRSLGRRICLNSNLTSFQLPLAAVSQRPYILQLTSQ